MSIDLFLGRRFTTFKQPPGYITSIHMDPSLWDSEDLWEHTETDIFVLEPNQFVLAQTLERVRIPNSLMGLAEGRSGFARLGVTVHATAPKIDPGCRAPITLEMANSGKLAVELRAGIDKPAQLLLTKITTPLEESELYGMNPEDIFQHQTEPIPRGRKSQASCLTSQPSLYTVAVYSSALAPYTSSPYIPGKRLRSSV